MVWFQCEDCGDNLKKPKLPTHFRQCSAFKLSCIDCGQVFGQHDVESHTQCITEAEKYGPKGQGNAGNGMNTKPKKDAKQRPEVDINVGLSERPPWFCSLCNTKATSKQALLLHADGKKHRAKARGFHAKQQGNETVETIVSSENNVTNNVSVNKEISGYLNSSVVDPPCDGSGVENNSLESNKKRKLEASENWCLCNTKATSKQALLLHADGKKHRAKARGFHAKQQGNETVETIVSSENNVTNNVSVNKEISGYLNSSVVDPPCDGSGVENNSLESNKKRKLEASENGDANHKTGVDVSAELGNGKVIQVQGLEIEVTKSSKKAKLSAKEEHGKLDSAAEKDASKNIKWKKLIVSALKSNPDGAMKLKKLKKFVVKSLKESGCVEDKNQATEMIEQKIESSSRFVVDGKYVRLASTS
ncbi:hypothetical protein SASPL_114548 [Salvia splendens]|uniref:U1-type domain-containing protein n=1 Tax=Salvia splendens TaxID=180675 RepID=A0A8X8Y251_SALSN|nr:UBP1-associated proteins 1C-like isoform X2 [Salvia splendens]KAG6424135.1 hypothetical protein SASPL_114548 [Salvia splendens]